MSEEPRISQRVADEAINNTRAMYERHIERCHFAALFAVTVTATSALLVGILLGKLL